MAEKWNLKEDPSFLMIRDYEDGMSVGVLSITYGRARIALFRTGTNDIVDDVW